MIEADERESSARSATPANDFQLVVPAGMMRAVAAERNRRAAASQPTADEPSGAKDFSQQRLRPQGLLAAGGGRAGDFLRLRGQKCPVPAARLVARRHGRADARQRAGAFGHDGGGRRLFGRTILSGLRAGSAAGDRGTSAASRCSSRPRSRSRPPTSSACWHIRRSASWAT